MRASGLPGPPENVNQFGYTDLRHSDVAIRGTKHLLLSIVRAGATGDRDALRSSVEAVVAEERGNVFQ